MKVTRLETSTTNGSQSREQIGHRRGRTYFEGLGEGKTVAGRCDGEGEGGEEGLVSLWG